MHIVSCSDGQCMCNERKLKMLDMLANMKEGDLMPEPGHIAANYCAIGKVSCGDLDTEEMCQCTQCPVFKENDLSTGYYCKLGKEN